MKTGIDIGIELLSIYKFFPIIINIFPAEADLKEEYITNSQLFVSYVFGRQRRCEPSSRALLDHDLPCTCLCPDTPIRLGVLGDLHLD